MYFIIIVLQVTVQSLFEEPTPEPIPAILDNGSPDCGGAESEVSVYV